MSAVPYSDYLILQLIRRTDAYYTQDSLEGLATVDDFPLLRSVQVPHNKYVCARNNGARRGTRMGGPAEPLMLPMTSGSIGSDPSPTFSSSSSSSSSTRYSSQPPISLPPTPPVPPAAPLPAGSVLAERRLAPLEYLQNISPRARDPFDDEALRQFQFNMSLA